MSDQLRTSRCGPRPRTVLSRRRCKAFGLARGGVRQRAFSLAELLVVVALLAITAAIALPSSSPVADQQLALAASELADALRFARDEARRSGQMHGVTIAADDTLRVFRLDASVAPPVPTFDVLHPLTRGKYQLQVGGDAAPIRLGTVTGSTSGSCGDAKTVVFDVHGAVRCLSPLTTRFANAVIVVDAAGRQSMVGIDGYSGRVVVK